jgi:hypothetical protein
MFISTRTVQSDGQENTFVIAHSSIRAAAEIRAQAEARAVRMMALTNVAGLVAAVVAICDLVAIPVVLCRCIAPAAF